MAVSTMYFITVCVIFILRLDSMDCKVYNPYDADTPYNTKNSRNQEEHDIGDVPAIIQHLTKPLFPHLSTPLAPSSPSFAAQEASTDSLPRGKFSEIVSNFLSPEMFAQPNPVLYLLRKATQLPRIKIFILDNTFKNIFGMQEKFPPRYAPYAQFARRLIRTLCRLDPVREAISKIQDPSLSAQLAPLSSISLYFEIPELFSPYIFSDSNAPFRLLAKLINMSRDQISDAKDFLMNFSKNKQNPEQYSQYAEALLRFLIDEFLLKDLKESISELKRFMASNSSSAPSRNTNNIRSNSPSSNDLLLKHNLRLK